MADDFDARKKKKSVAFSVDPLGADADPTTPAPLDDDEPTVHEQMKKNAEGANGAAPGDDFDAMFGDLKKKKKKKKDIPMDLVRICCISRSSRSSLPMAGRAGRRRIWCFHTSRRDADT